MNGRMAGVVAAMAISGGATAQDAVQWRVEDGGNGHWYVVHAVTTGITWTGAKAAAEGMHSTLACLESNAEREFVLANFRREQVPTAWTSQGGSGQVVFGPWLGGFQLDGSTEPLGDWYWLSGAPLNPSATIECCNNSCSGSTNENRLHLFFSPTQLAHGWNDLPDNVTCGLNPRGYLIEFDADCNSDGIVDFGQIRGGTLADANLNNIPDCCEGGPNCGPCIADVVQDGTVNGVDLAAVINAWGTDGGKLPRADIDGSGLVDGADLAQVLGSWGPCN